MQLDKAQIIDTLRQQGNNPQADQADQELPDQVDTDQHAGLLERVGLNPQELISRFTGRRSARHLLATPDVRTP